MTSIEVRRQFYAAISANFIGFSFGWNCAWANANFIHFTSEETTLDKPLSTTEATYFMSLVCVGGLSGNLIYLWIIKKYGRKVPILFLGLPTIISWLLVVYARDVYWLYASRILCGFVGGALFISVPIFVSEICSDSVRGIVNAMGFFIGSLGSLIGFIIALYCDFRMQAVYALSVPVLFMLMFSFVPESPAYLYKKNKIALADISSRYYKGPNATLNQVCAPESEKMMTDTKNEIRKTSLEASSDSCEKNVLEKTTDTSQQLYTELNSCSRHEEITVKKEVESDPSAMNRFERLRDLVKTRAARRAVSISMFLVFLPQFCGCYILISYSTPYFAEAGSTLTPLQSSILICIVQLIANLFTVILIDRLGRKILFTTSSIGAGLGMIVLALHNFYKDELPGTNWVPMYGLSFTIFIGSVGLLPVPFIITVDVLPANIREITMTITAMSMWILGFFTNAAYICLLEAIKLYGCLIVFSIGCFCCAIYAIIFIPETKGKSYQSIARLLERP